MTGRQSLRQPKKIADGDFRKMVAYGFTVAGICTGLRPGELRKARVNDLDLKRGILHAEEVKGKDRYGEPRHAAIHPDGLPFLKRYCQVRVKAIAEKATTNDFLFPALGDGDGYYLQQGLSELRRMVRKGRTPVSSSMAGLAGGPTGSLPLMKESLSTR